MITIELADGDQRAGEGWVTSGHATSSCASGRARRSTKTDDAGRFTFTSVERGLVHLLMRRLDSPTAVP